MTGYIKQHSSTLEFLSGNSWVILNPIEKRIKEKIERVGTPLKDWDISINYGIKTGCNEAFIINKAKRDEIIAKDKKSAEIIRPILRGKDIKRYGYEFADLYLLYVPWHFPLHLDTKITGVSKKAEEIFKKEYPAVYNHLLQYKDILSARNAAETGIRYEWYALQRWGANYSDDFSKQKIVWGNLNLNAAFSFAPEGMFVNAPCPMIVPATNYLLAILNSKLADYYIRGLGVTRNGGYFEYKPMFIEKLPVPSISDEIDKKIIKLLQTKNYKAIDVLVYELYNLDNNEVKFIESL